MFSIFQLVTIVSIVISIVFLILFVQLNAFENSQRKILFLLISFDLVMFVIDLLISYSLFEIIVYIFPIFYIILFAIYPFIYLYFRKFAFSKLHPTIANSYKHLLLTAIAAFIILVYYIPLTFDNKIDFILDKLIIRLDADLSYQVFQYLIYSLYYAQFLFYMYLFIRLLKNLKLYNLEKTKINFPIKNWIMIFIAGSVFFEVLIIIVTVSFSAELYKGLEQFISFTYIVFIGFLGINQSKLLIQVRLYQTIGKSGKVLGDINSERTINEEEKREIRRLIELIIKEKKLYLDPNLKIDHFAKKIHVPVKKLSQTIHNIYGKNFTNFINDYRIQEAIKILNSSKKFSVDELSHTVGFNSRSTFNRSFKTFTELTPRDYIINHKISNDL